MNTKILALTFLTIFFHGCFHNVKNNIPQAEKLFGKGWVCKTVPDGFIKAGVVYEVAEGVEYFEADYSARAKTSPSGIGTLKITEDRTYGGTLELLKAIEIFDADTSVTAQIDTKTTLDINYGKTNKTVIGGADVNFILSELLKTNLKPSSRYVVIREAHTTTSIGVSIDKNAFAKLSGKVSVEELVSINPKISDDGKSKYHIYDTFSEPVGVCSLAYELDVRSGLDGQRSIAIGDVYINNSEKLISSRGH